MSCLIISTGDREGGAARAAYRLHKGLLDWGYDSSMVVQYKQSDDPTVMNLDGKLAKTFNLLRPGLDNIPLKLYTKRQRTPWTLSWLPKNIDNQIKKINPDVVNLHWVCNGFVPVQVLKKIKQPIVWTLHDSWAFTGGCHTPLDCKNYCNKCGTCPQLMSCRRIDLSSWVWKRKSKNWRGLSMTIVTPSRWLAECARESSLFRNQRIEVIPNGLDVSVYTPVDKLMAKKLLGLNTATKLILFGANGVLEDNNKGFGRLCDAIRSGCEYGWLRGMELGIFGTWAQPDIKDMDMKVRWLGRFSDDISLRLVYSAADVLVMPSSQEAFGQVALEAMACGTPVAAFRATGLLDVVDHKKNGYLAEPFSAIELAAGIRWVLEEDERWRELSHNAREKVLSDFDIRKVSKRYSDLYCEIAVRYIKF